MEKKVWYLGYFSISFEKIYILFTEILTQKVELWIFSLVWLIKNNFSLHNVKKYEFFGTKILTL